MVGEDLKHHQGVVEGGSEHAGEVVFDGQARTRRVGTDLVKEFVAVRLLLRPRLGQALSTFASR